MVKDQVGRGVRIRGDGIVGCAAALALSRLSIPVVVEAWSAARSGPVADAADIRTYALNAASIDLLRRLKVWDALPPDAACAVSDMLIAGDAGGELQFSAWEQGLAELAWIVDAGALEATLRQALRYAPHVTVVAADPNEDALPPVSPEGLLLLCEGRDSRSRTALGVRFERQAYGHQALAARVVADRPHDGVASQWFGAPSVLALLPFHRPQAGHAYGLVWSLPQEQAQRLAGLDEAAFEAALFEATGGACGRLRLVGPRQTWPLALGRADRTHGPGWLLLGDCAHTVHPLAGQGLNLGLADVAELERVMVEREAWRPIGDERLLARHSRRRAEATLTMAGLTDGLWQLFSQSHPLLRAARNRGMTMMNRLTPIKRALTRRALGLGLAAVCAAAALGALMVPQPALANAPTPAPAAIEAAIRKALTERMPALPKPDEISRTAVPGLFELRFGNELLYTDERGDYIISGPIVETRSRRDLTAERLDRINAIPIAQLPLKDAIVIKQGAGTRRVVVFSDPNCGFCKRYERELLGLKDVTLYTFLYPILGKDSQDKSRNIWCSADPAKAWRDWMVDGRQPVTAMGRCDASALERNVALGQKHRVDSTPTTVLEDGTRRNGSLPANELDKLLTPNKPAKS